MPTPLALVTCAAILIFAGVLHADGPATTQPAKRVALLFDDGPSPATGERLAALFEREGVVANFALVGRNVEQHADVARAYQAAGHEILNHSLTHAHPADLDDAAMRAEVVESQRILEETLDERPVYYWTPFGEFDARMPALWEEANLKAPPFDRLRFISTSDWDAANVDADAIEAAALRATEDLTVILFHEWRAETVERMPAIVAALKSRGYAFVTISELEAALGE